MLLAKSTTHLLFYSNSFCKVLAVVSQNGYYWVPRERVWEVMNDLIAEGVANDTMNILLMEMSDLYLIRTWTDKGVEYVRFQSPALGMYNE